MNALSALRQLLPSGSIPSGNGGSVLPGRAIPAAELQPLTPGIPISPGAAALGEVSGENAFPKLLAQMVHDVNAKQVTARQSVQDLQSGNTTSLHQTMIAMEEAGVSFSLMVEVRNKLFESYQELMRMGV